MHNTLKPMLLAAAVAIALGAPGILLAAETTSQEVTDARQEVQIWTTYALSPYLRANDLEVSVHGGVAVLTGTVDEGVNKDLAKQIALGVGGITEVDNQIVVKEDYVAPAMSKARDYGNVIDDATITAAIMSKLAWSKYTSATTTKVETRGGAVTLLGTADTAASRDLVGRLARNTRGVNSVDNKLLVAGVAPTAGAKLDKTVAATEGKLADTWITTKIKSTYLYSTNIASNDITVSTSSGVVTLSGRLASGPERELAIELARNVRGVRSVESKGLTL